MTDRTHSITLAWAGKACYLVTSYVVLAYHLTLAWCTQEQAHQQQDNLAVLRTGRTEPVAWPEVVYQWYLAPQSASAVAHLKTEHVNLSSYFIKAEQRNNLINTCSRIVLRLQ